MQITKIGKDIIINIPRDNIKQFYRGNLMLQIDKTGKSLVDTSKLKTLIKKPLKKDTFSKMQPCVSLENMV